MTIKSLRSLILLNMIVLMTLTSSPLWALDKDDEVIYSGYFSREQNDGELAKMSGKSHYVKFFAENRFIRLYIPYPFSKSVTAAQINEIFEVVGEKYKVDAYIKDDFGVLDEKIIAHIDRIRRVNDEIMFDCGFSAPCKILFDKDSFKVIKKGIVKDHVTLYHHVKE